MISSDLPREILIDIFSRLPAKSVGQYRCLSKPWRHILSSSQFIKSHLNRKTHQESLLLIDEYNSIHSIPTIKDGFASRELEFPFDCTEIVGSCDGLVLLVNKKEDDYKFLVNPVTLEKVIIPNNPLALVSIGEEITTMHGFGYDSSIDDYKIVTLSYSNFSDNDNEWECEETFVDVHFVKRGVWKRVGSSPYDHAFHEPHSGAFLNGAIHWLTRTSESSYRSLLVAFDLFDEVFTEIPAPDDIKLENLLSFQLVVLGGCLCVIDIRDNDRTIVWMMKEYGLVESWEIFYVVTCSKWGIEKPLCFVGDQEMVSASKRLTLWVYNLKEGTLREMYVRGVLTTFKDGVTFVPSLVSPAYGRCPQFHEDIHRELGRLTTQYAPDDLGHLSIPKHVWRQVYDLCAPFRDSFL